MLDLLIIVFPGVLWLPSVFLLGVAVMLVLPTKLESVVMNDVSASLLLIVPLCMLVVTSWASLCRCCFWKRLMESAAGASGKSTTNAFILRPYRKLAKLSPNLLRLSCISCRCMKLASRSAIESLSSANCGSRASRARAGTTPLLCDPRNDDLEEGRRGVVGRDTGERDRGRTGRRLREAERGCSMFDEAREGFDVVQTLYRRMCCNYDQCCSRLDLAVPLHALLIAFLAWHLERNIEDGELQLVLTIVLFAI